MKVEEEPRKIGGIYVHIPFCHQACSYCDFYFSVQKKYIPNFIHSILHEIELRKYFFQEKESIQTLYFGGGTPSILENKDLEIIFQKILEYFPNMDLKEVTIEANPEDITKEKLSFWKKLGINRISLGVQSIHEEELKFMRRNHTVEQIFKALESIQNSEISNYTVDVIYGIPNGNLNKLEQTLNKLIQFQPTHFSCYALTIEPKTLLDYQLKKNQFTIHEESYLMEYEFIVDFLKSNGYLRYELSNFAKYGFESKHNSSYWRHNPYLGLGPSAHSFYGKTRSANISNLHIYNEKIQKNEIPLEMIEELEDKQLAIEELMFQIRQNKGIKNMNHEWFEEWEIEGWIYLEGNKIFFTNKGLMLSDSLILQLI